MTLNQTMLPAPAAAQSNRLCLSESHRRAESVAFFPKVNGIRILIAEDASNQGKTGYKLYFAVTDFIFQPQQTILST
jgi:hypothetical protein